MASRGRSQQVSIVMPSGRMLSRNKEVGLKTGCVVGQEEVRVSHLQFADDTMLFLSEGSQEFKNSLTLLQIFETIAGLMINLVKCGLARIHLSS